MLDEKGSDGKHLTSHPSHDYSPFTLSGGQNWYKNNKVKAEHTLNQRLPGAGDGKEVLSPEAKN